MIKIQSLHKYFNKGRQNEIHVINNANLELPQKGMVAIFGKSGCGKTTLLNVIGGLDRYQSGTVFVNGENISENTDVVRNRDMGYIFQNYNLNKEVSCFDNVADALRLCGITDENVLEERVSIALKNVDMEKYAKRTPDTLSGGQQQRIAIARAIVKNPKIILADEPTGNLDEANTIMIMDLLKEISKDHLVLLVTHEANLVDFYCDTVIELSDGKVVDIKTNQNADGYSQRDKNTIYLGELEKNKIQSENIEIEYYGEAPQNPLQVKLVNNNGKFYLKVESEGVHIIDGTGEIKLVDGVFKEKKEENEKNKKQMADLPPVEGTKFGTLFSLKSSLKSGYISFSKNKKKGRKLLRRCMILFGAVLVFMSAVFGVMISELLDVENSYNHNVFYVYTPDGKNFDKINNAVGKEDSAIDYIRMMHSYPNGDTFLNFETGAFETFKSAYELFDNSIEANAVVMGISVADGLELICGKNKDLQSKEMVITTKVADKLLEESTFGYIKKHEDLLGLISNISLSNGKRFVIAGIVKSNETAVYLSEQSMADYALKDSDLSVFCGMDGVAEVNAGECILAVNTAGKDEKIPSVGDVVKISGKELKISKVLSKNEYSKWLEINNISKLDENSYFAGEEDKIETSKYFEYLDYYYSELDRYLEENLLFYANDKKVWLAVEKDVEEAKYAFISNDYYKAYKYKELYGRYPSSAELKEAYNSLPYWSTVVDEKYSNYENEYYQSVSFGYLLQNKAYFVSESDYVEISKRAGETHPTALRSVYYNYNFDDYNYHEDIYDIYGEAAEMDIIGRYEGYTTSYAQGFTYVLIHSKNPEVTQKWIEENASDIEIKGDLDPIVTPKDLFNKLIERNKEDIISSLVSMAVLLILLSVCMYFIMRSSLMARIKEVGIYRAIGVSKKNIIYKFAVEAFVVASLTVLLGYLFSSGFIAFCMWISPMIKGVFFYPWWMALGVLTFLYALSIFCGTIPVMSLLRKTPSEILAKYDI